MTRREVQFGLGDLAATMAELVATDASEERDGPPAALRSDVRGLLRGLHQRYQVFEASFDVILETGLRLVAIHPSPIDDGINAIYVFQRKA